MPRFALFRDYDPTTTRAQLDGVALAGAAALQTYVYRGGSEQHHEPHGISWIRSYWEPGGRWGMCVFDAPNLAVLAGFQELCGTPYVDAMEVEEIPGDASGSPDPQLALTMQLPPALPLRTALRDALPASIGRLVRAYSSPDRHSVVALLHGSTAEDVGAKVPAARVIELTPADYA